VLRDAGDEEAAAGKQISGKSSCFDVQRRKSSGNYGERHIKDRCILPAMKKEIIVKREISFWQILFYFSWSVLAIWLVLKVMGAF